MTITPGAVENRQPTPSRASGVKVAVFIAAILCVQLGFILSYVGAFHAPVASRIAVAVVAPAAVRGEVVSRLNAIPGSPVLASAASSADAATAALRRGDTSGIYTVDATGSTDTLTIATAGGASIATALETVFQQADASQSRSLVVKDAVPVQSGDGRGLTGFYLVTGWLVGGYLLAAVLGILLGTALSGVRQALVRLGLFVPYAILSGVGGALVVDQGLGAITGHFWPIAAVGALVVLAGAVVTVGLQSFLGIVGIGVSIVLFVVLGNPSAGGAYQAPLLPPFWRAISQALPNGAATTALRDIVYFDGNHIAGPLLLVACYAAAGVAVTLLAATLRERRSGASPATTDRSAG